MSVTPIQDDIQVQEVGEQPKVDKSQIHSQSLPLPPMTVTQFEEMVAGVVNDIIRPDKGPPNIEISNLQPEPKAVEINAIDTISTELAKISQSQDFISSAQGTQVPVPPVPPVAPQAPQTQQAQVPQEQRDPSQSLSDIESMLNDLLSKINSTKSSSQMGGEGHTTRSFVDEVLGGTRNLEGEKLVEVANFLGEDEGVSFREEEDGTFTKMQDGEVVAEGLSQDEANEWISDKERADASRSEDIDAARSSNENPDSISTESTIIKDTDTSTAEARPFSFDPNYMIYMNLESSVYKDHIYKILETPSSNGYWYLECTVQDGEITEVELKTDKTWVAYNIEGYCTFNGTGSDRVQTKAELPIATEFDGELNFISTGGFYEPMTLCSSGTPIVYPIKVS